MQIHLIKVNFPNGGVDGETGGNAKCLSSLYAHVCRPSVHEYSKWRSPRIINMTGKHKMSTPSKLPCCLLTLRGRDRVQERIIPPDPRQAIWKTAREFLLRLMNIV